MFLKRNLTCAAFLTFALATPFKRDAGIAVRLENPSTQNSSGDLELVATVTNLGLKNAKILKYGTILDDKLPTRSFVVTKNGNPVPFTGIKVSVSLGDVDDIAFAILAPGQNVTVTHKVAALYDFAAAGSGKFNFRPITDFVMLDSGKTEKYSSKDSSFLRTQATLTNSIEIDIQGIAKRELIKLNERDTDVCNNTEQKAFIDASYTEAKALARMSSSYIATNGANDTVYQDYFGTTPTADVIAVLDAVANENNSTRTLNCVDEYDACSSSGLVAYTVIATSDTYFCSIFFDELPSTDLCTGTAVDERDIRGGTTLHELTHAVGNTVDIAYGCPTDQILPTDADKLGNADNFNCFTTQVYADTKC